jgi:excinuclease ABC subunit A
MPELSPRIFSFNSPQGACQTCDGLGALLEFDEELIVNDPALSLMEGCLKFGDKTQGYWYIATVHSLAKSFKFDYNTPWEKLSKQIRKVILYGDKSIKIDYDFRKKIHILNFQENTKE